MMKQVLCAGAIVCACFSLPACSEKKDVDTPQELIVLKEGPLKEGEGPALWQTGDEDTKVYLFGTVHVLPPSLIWRNDVFESAFDEAQTVYFEADVSGQDPALARAVAKLGFMPMGKDLFSMLSPSEVTEVEEAANKLNLPTASISRMQPWFAAMMLAMQSIVAQGQDPESGVEQVLEPEARSRNKELRYFETAEQQLSFMANLNEDVQLTMLMETVRQIDELGQSIIEMDNAWVVGDIEKLSEIVLSDPSMASDEMMDVMLINRNKDWVIKLDELIEKEEGTFFVAVGAAHLVGEDSVVSMLEANGYSVDRVQ